MDERIKENVFTAFMALHDDTERGRFLTRQFFLHKDAQLRYAEIKSIDEAEEQFKGKIELLRDMVCQRAGMPEFWEWFYANFVRLYKEANERVQEAEREARIKK